MSDPLPRTPPDAIREVVRERVIVGGREFLIEKPSGSDDLLDHPSVRAAFAADEYLPYWADLWPAARMLAKAVLAEPWPDGWTALRSAASSWESAAWYSRRSPVWSYSRRSSPRVPATRTSRSKALESHGTPEMEA